MKTRVPIEKLVLVLIGVVGVMALIAVAPGLAVLLKHFNPRGRYPQSSTQRAINRLTKKGYLKRVSSNSGPTLVITREGRALLIRYQVTEARHRSRGKQRWDGKWRIVMFDISEHARKVRDALRYELAEYGFKKLQNSVWIYPHACEEYIKLIRAEHRLGKGVLYAEVDQIEYGKDLVHLFKLERQ